MKDFRRVADDVRNWGRWGDDDELGTLNLITADKVAQAAALVSRGKVFPLGVEFGSSGPQGAFKYRQNPTHVMTIDGGDANTLMEYGPKWLRNPGAVQLSSYSKAGPMRFNDDMIIMPLQSGTQWDALAHIMFEDKMYNGYDAKLVDARGAKKLGIEHVRDKMAGRGVLLHQAVQRGLLGPVALVVDRGAIAMRPRGLVSVGLHALGMGNLGWCSFSGRAGQRIRLWGDHQLPVPRRWPRSGAAPCPGAPPPAMR